MTKTYCDICGDEKEVYKKTLCYEYACSAWQYKEFDICEECDNKIEEQKNQLVSKMILKRKYK